MTKFWPYEFQCYPCKVKSLNTAFQQIFYHQLDWRLVLVIDKHIHYINLYKRDLIGKVKNENFMHKGCGWETMVLFPGFSCASVLPM